MFHPCPAPVPANQPLSPYPDDINQDPTRSSKRNHIDELLDGNAGGATVPLVMGLSIAPPEPALAKDDVNKFNVVADRRQPVFDPSGPQQPHLPEPRRTPSDYAFLPVDPSSSWDEVGGWWREATNGDRAATMVERWAEKLGFAKGSVVGKQPTHLLDLFNQLVPAVPLVAVGGGAC